MKRRIMHFLLAALLIPLLSAPLSSVELKNARTAASIDSGELSVSIRLIGGRGSVFRPGRDIRLTFQTNRDAYVVLYNIDSEGLVTLLLPENDKPYRVEGRKVYFLPENGKGMRWAAGDKTGIEYIHALAVTDRNQIKEEELYFLAKNKRLPGDKQLRIDFDPLLAFNMLDEEILVDAEAHAPATDYTYFYINRKVEYPRFLCAKCHSPNNLPDPYAMECPEVVIEKADYEEDLAYPYPALFDVRYLTQEEDEDYYTSTDYADREKEYLEDDDYDDYDRLYLSIFYTNYDYPYYHRRPFYWRTHTWGLYDQFWWDFGWYWHWTDYYYWPYYTWHYPTHFYWDYQGWYGPYDRCCYYKYRPVYTSRTIARRATSYNYTMNKMRNERILADSRLTRTRSEGSARRLERSTLARRVSRRTPDRVTRLRSMERTTRSRDVKTRVVHGDRNAARTSRRTRNLDERTRSRETSPASGTRERSSTREREKASGSREERSRTNSTRSTTREKRSSKARSTTRSGSSTRSRKKSSSDLPKKRSSATRSSGSGKRSRERATSNRSSTSTRKAARSNPAPARSSGRSSGSSSSSSGRSNSSGSSRSRRK